MSSNNKVAIVTGGAGLLGKVFTKFLAQAGHHVVVADVKLAAAEAVAKELAAEGLKVSATRMDITSKQSLEEALQFARSLGPVETLVNNAYPKTPQFNKSFFEVEYKDFCENMNLHVGGYFLAAQVFGKHFQEQRKGSIINLGSIYGVIAPRFEIYDNTSLTLGPEYPAIKSSIIMLTKYMAQFFKGSGVTVNSVCPGGIADGQPDAFMAAYKSYCNTKGMLAPQDVAGMIVFLASPEARFVTGQNITVDDGFTL